MPNKKFDLTAGPEDNRSSLRVFIERAAVVGGLTCTSLLLIDTHTEVGLGINPLNYVVALSEYSAK